MTIPGYGDKCGSDDLEGCRNWCPPLMTAADDHEVTPAPWLELARRIQARITTYDELAESYWRQSNYMDAIRYREMANGLRQAQGLQLEVVAEAKEAAK